MNLQDAGLLKERGWINGAWVGAADHSLPVLDPATGEVLARVPRMGASETAEAIRAANDAQALWRKEPAMVRATVLRKMADLMMEHREDLARILSAEEGKPLVESRGEIAYAASFLQWFSEEAPRVYGDIIPPHKNDVRIVVQREPIGVTAAITPWNFPSAMITRKLGPAIAVGCSMVLKPAEDTPLSALAIAELSHRAGLPPGVFNVVTGSREDSKAIGRELCTNPTVRKLSFTGSIAVGKYLLEECASTVKKVSLELGGNAPFIVFDDADIDAAVDGAIACKFRNSGQVCIAANRFLIQAGIFEEFKQKFRDRIASLQVGNGFETPSQVGPLITEAAVEKVERHIQDALSRGAILEVGGKRHHLGGTFFEPTLLSNVSTKMVICQEETFGPVAGLVQFEREEEAIQIANDTPCGLAAYFFSRDNARVWRVSEGLEYGMVGANTGMMSTAIAPFGGMKESGLGREGSHYGTDEWLETKYVCMGGISL